ncbi:MAG TPA: hypothetical protein VIF62_16285 [Labilithrix sp.]|jgi:hypothetical protein
MTRAGLTEWHGACAAHADLARISRGTRLAMERGMRRGCTLIEAIALMVFCAGLATMLAGFCSTMSERREDARVAEIAKR